MNAVTDGSSLPRQQTAMRSVRGFKTLQRLSKELDLHTYSAKGGSAAILRSDQPV